MGFFSKVVSAVKSIFSAAKGVVNAAEKALTTGKASDVKDAISQIENTINEVDKLIKLLEGPKKQKTTTGAEDSGIFPTLDEIKARWNSAVDCDLKIAQDFIYNTFNKAKNSITKPIYINTNQINGAIAKQEDLPYRTNTISNYPCNIDYNGDGKSYSIPESVADFFNHHSTLGLACQNFKNQINYQLAQVNGIPGPDGIFYVPEGNYESNAKLADAGASMLTGELGGAFGGVAINGIRSYNNIKNGEKLSSEFVAGSGIGGAAGKGGKQSQGPINKKVGTEFENYVEEKSLKGVEQYGQLDTQRDFVVQGLKQRTVKPDYVITDSNRNIVAIGDAKTGVEIPFDDQARGFIQVAQQTKSKTIIYYTPNGDTPIAEELYDAAQRAGVIIRQIGVK